MFEKTGLVLLSGLLFAITLAGVSVSTRHIPPATLTALRLATASAVIGVVLALWKPLYQWQWRSTIDIAVIGLLNIGLPFLCLAFALAYISSSLAAVMFYLINRYTASLAGFSGISTPLFSALIGIVFLHEVVTTPILAGTLLVLLGVGALNYF